MSGRDSSLATPLTLAAIIEVTTGVVVLIAPAMVVRWLLGSEPPSSAVARCFGIALLALGAACWPTEERSPVQAFRAMSIYNALIALYLVLVQMIGHVAGPLLWPVVALHAAIACWLVWASRLPRT
jgi:hypothetical protein